MTPEAEGYRTQLRAMLPELRERFGVATLGLFGSRVRGDHRPDSDLDVLVTFEPGRTPGLAFFDLEDEIAAQVGLPVHLTHRDSLKPRLRPYILREVQGV